jgi:ribosomal protein S12 methylthiotransferase accessory factor
MASGLAGLHEAIKRFGITRVGDLTGLDTLGIPVWFAARPNSRTLSVSQGKGMTHVHARLSAVMESLEDAVAEDAERLVQFQATPDELRASGHAVVPFERLPRCLGPGLSGDGLRYWVLGNDMATGKDVLAPYELVGLDLRSGAAWDGRAFHMSSIGLAAAFSAERAAVHAIFEVVENDATAAAEVFGFIERDATPLAYLPGGHAGLDEAMRILRSAGIEPLFYGFASPLGLPVIGCFVNRALPGKTATGVRTSAGFACRFDAHEAALAALLEAAQSRVTDVAGAREDIAEADYQASPRPVTRRREPLIAIAETEGHSPALQAAEAPQQLRHLIGLVRRELDESLYVFMLAPEDAGFEAVRVLIPKLVHPSRECFVRTGPRP